MGLAGEVMGPRRGHITGPTHTLTLWPGQGDVGAAPVARDPHSAAARGRAAGLPEVLPAAAGTGLLGGPHPALPDWQRGGGHPPPLRLSAAPRSGEPAQHLQGQTREALSAQAFIFGLCLQVVTAETLREPSDGDDSDQALGSREVSNPQAQPGRAPLPLQASRTPSFLLAGQGFRLEDTDWNSIARRYPNLFTDFEPNPEPR